MKSGDGDYIGLRRPSVLDLTGEGTPSYSVGTGTGASGDFSAHDDLYLTLAESTQDYLFLINRDLLVVYVNASGARQFNMAPEQMTGQHLSALFPTAAFDRRQASIARVFQTGATLCVEEKFLFPTGVMWVSSHLVPVRGSDGSVLYVLETLLDITKRKLAEEELASRYGGLAHQLDEKTARINQEKLALQNENWALRRSAGFARIESDLAGALIGGADITRCLEISLEAALQIDGVDGGAMYVVDEKSGDLHLMASKGVRQDGTGKKQYHSMSSPLALQVMQGVPFYKDRTQSTLVPADEDLGEGLWELAVFPIKPRNRVVAALHLFSRISEELDSEERATLERCVGHVETALKRMMVETRVHKSKEKYRVLFERAEDALFVLDGTQERILDCNLAAQAVTGYQRQELRQLSALDLHPPGERELATLCLRNDNPSAGGAVSSFSFQRKDGRIYPVEILDTKVHLGNRVLVLRAVRDMSERQAIEVKKRSLDREVQHIRTREALSRLAGGVAHVFNNLLVGIVGNADLARTLLSGNADALPFVVDILDTADQMSQVTHRMLEYFGRTDVHLEPCDLNRIAQDVARTVEVSLPPDVKLTQCFDDEMPEIIADSKELRQVVINLINNAVEACGDGQGEITITTNLMDMGFVPGEHKFAVIEVTDTGKGMDEETLSKVFDPFFSTKFAGRGLGLAAVEGIVQGCGGTISANSRPGEGSTFKVLIPLEPEDAASATQEQSKVVSSAP